MAYDVITHGGGEGLVYVFNAVASLFNGKKALGTSLVYIASSFALILMVMTMVAKQELLPTAKWFFGSLIITSALMVPKVDIIVKDRITKLERPVANVPFMLGAFAGIASQLGDILAKQMDAIFAKAGPDYRGNGVAMASQLLAKVNHFHIPDPLMASNVRGFVQQCMVFDIAKGKYTIKELHRSEDIWKLLKENASKARGFVYRTASAQSTQNKKPIKSEILTCEEGANKLENAWSAAYKEAALVYGSRLYPQSNNPAHRFIENLPLAHQYLTKLSQNAESILQQSMLSNAIDDGLLELNQLTDANAAVIAYAAKRAQSQQRVAYSLQGNMASLSLSVLKVVVEILFYGLFPMIVAISIFPGGWVIIKKYLIALFWIQSWAPMYAILNMILNVYGTAKSSAAVSMMGKGMLNMVTLKTLGEANEWVSSVAGYAMMSVPFLSYGIIHYGAGALSQLSTHFGSVTQSAASHAAEEATTGNYSMGNTNFDNHSRSNVHGFKYDTNMNVSTGRTTFQQEDGSLISKNRNGENVLDKTPSISNLGTSFTRNTGASTAFSNMADESYRTGVQHSQSMIENRAAAFAQFQEARNNRTKGRDSSDTFVAGDSVYKDSGMAKLSSLSDDLVEKFGVERNIANQLVVGGGLDLGAGGSASTSSGYGGRGSGANANASLNIKGGLSGRHTETTQNSKNYQAAMQYLEKQDLANSWKKAENEAKEGRYSTIDNEQKNYGNGITANLNESFAHQEMATASFNEEKAYRKSAQMTATSGVEATQNMAQEVYKNIEKKHGAKEASEMFSEPETNSNIREEFVNAQKPKMQAQFEENEAYSTRDALRQNYERHSEAIIAEKNLDNAYIEYQNWIMDKVEREGLTHEIKSDVPKRVLDSIQETNDAIADKEKAFIEEKARMQDSYQAFKQDNKARDYYQMGETFVKDTFNNVKGILDQQKFKKTKSKIDTDTPEGNNE